MVNDPSKDFPIKYSALKTARFFWELRPDVISKEQVLAVMELLMANPDISDMPMEDLRKWQVWGLTTLVLAYAEKESHKTIPIINRAILKFALSAAKADPKNTAAVAFVKAARDKDAKKVEFLEELLKEELKPVTPPSPNKEVAKPNG
jgi:hypothetical protein